MGFKVIQDYIKEHSEKGAIGTESIVPNPAIRQYKGIANERLYTYLNGTIKARLLDDDGRVCFHGLLDDIHFSSELFIEWGRCYAGCTSLELHIRDYATTFGQPKYPKLLSSDGTWYAFID